MGGVEVVRFMQMKGLSIVRGKWESGFDADEKSVVFASELGKGIEGGFECFGRVLCIFYGGAVRAEKVAADRGGVEDDEGGESVFVETEGFVAFELFVFFPDWRLEKVLIHKRIIS